jgi:DNA-directed RNA polymerase specialized sigma24 family protein
MNKIRSDATDLQLVEAVRNNNKSAFGIICNRYHEDVINHLKAKTSNNLYLKSFIEDAASEAFIILWESIIKGKYEEQGYVKAFLQKIAFRKLMKMNNKNIKPIGNGSEISDEENYYELNELLDEDSINYKNIADEAFRSLKQICKEIILLKLYEKLDDTVIFEKFPEELISIRNVSKRRLKCMNKLRDKSNEILKQIK